MLRNIAASVSLCFTWQSCAEVAEWIKILLGVETLGEPSERCIRWKSDFLYGFHMAFAKLLWPLVYCVSVFFSLTWFCELRFGRILHQSSD